MPKKSIIQQPPTGFVTAQEILKLSREPFRQELARLVGCAPTQNALLEFSSKSPDRWAQAISIMAKLAGYSEKIIHEHNVSVLIAQMSDAELQSRLTKLEHDGEVASHAIDAQFAVVSPTVPATVTDTATATATATVPVPVPVGSKAIE